jgi:hypothetical protein
MNLPGEVEPVDLNRLIGSQRVGVNSLHHEI